MIARRDRVVARVQQHYYADPPRIERGWRQHLIDTSGRAYLDMVNNVAVLGHSHPAVTAAAGRQFGLLNTNSRFSYDGIVSYAERIVDLLPDPLDTVLFVNSGSEAVDLALRIVRNFTGRKDTICLAGGYHGWSTATDEISTSLNDNPNAAATRPPWVYPAPMPNLYRGEHRGPDAADRYADAVRDILAGLPDGPAAFVAEPLSGNAGGVELPAGYLRAGVPGRARRRRAGDLRRGADRVRTDRKSLLGIPAARRGAGRDHHGEGGRKRPPHRICRHPAGDRRALRRTGVVLLVRGRQSGLLGRRHRRSRHDPRRGPAGQRRPGRRPPVDPAGRRSRTSTR